MDFQVTASRNSVLLSAYRWFLELRIGGGYDYDLSRKISSTYYEGRQLNVCPIIGAILRGIFITMPIKILLWVVLPLFVMALLGGAVWILIEGSYLELSHWSETFDWVAAAKVAGVAIGFVTFVALFWKPIGYLLMYLLVGLVYTVGGIIWVWENAIEPVLMWMSPALNWIGNFVFGKIPTTKKKTPSGTIAVLGAWIKGYQEKNCPTLTVTA